MTSLVEDWGAAWMQLAQDAAKNSTCVRRQVGAVLVSRINLPVRTTWNVENPRELRCDKGECPRGTKSYEEQPAYAAYDDCVAIHAEVWLTWGYEGHGSEYTVCVTEKPCADCQAHLDKYRFNVVYPGMEEA